MSDTTDTDQGLTAAEAAELRRQLDDAKAGRALAERSAQSERSARRTAEMQNMSAQERSLVSNIELCDGSIESRDAEIEGIENQIAQLADEPGHGKEIAQLNRKMAEAVTEVADLKRRKTYLESERERLKAAAPRQSADSTDDATDRVLPNGQRMSNFGPRTQEWLLKHPKAFTDARYFGAAVAAAVKAVQAKGIADQSDEYFEFIEKELDETPARQVAQAQDGEDDGDEDGDEIVTEPTPKNPQTRAAGPGSIAAVAPPTRTTPTTGGSGRKRGAPALTADEREVADNLYHHMPNQADRYLKYSENKRIMNARNPAHFASH